MTYKVREQATASHSQPREHQSLGPRILAVDDDEGFCQTLVDILEARGYRADPTFCAAEALAAVERERYDLILLDLKLPDMNGIELLARVKLALPGVPVILLTGHATVDTAVRAMSEGAYSYLEKPCRPERLFIVIEQALFDAGGRTGDGIRELASILAGADLPVFTFDARSGSLLRYNQACRRLLAGSQYPILAKLLPDPDMLTAHLESLKNSGRAATDFAPLDGSGRRLRLVSYGAPHTSHEFLSLVLDVTSSYEEDAENQRVRQYFEAVFSNIAVGIMIVNSDYVIQQVNPAFANLCQAAPRAIAGRRCYEVIHRYATPCHLQGEVCPIKNCLATGTTCRVQHQHLVASGDLHFVENTMTPLRDAAGTIVCFVAIFADFTDIKHAQEASEAKSCELTRLNEELTSQREQIATQAEELKKANLELLKLSAAKSDFVSMVSHELRTPLTAITEGVSLVADQTLGPVTAIQGRFLDLALANARRLADIVNDLLDLSKIEAGRLERRPVSIELSAFLEEACAAFQPVARQKGLTLDVATGPMPRPVLADERMLRRVLANLLSNAIKFTDHGGVVVRARVEGEEAVVSVTDSGIGIPATEHAGMFQKFHQVHRRDGTRPTGTGLGLALTKEMVAMNRGRIWFESRPGAGSTFSFTLPLDTTMTRVGALLERLSQPGFEKAQALLLVRVQDPAGREQTGGHRDDVLNEVVQRLQEAEPPVHDYQVLPDDYEILALLVGTPDQLELQTARITDTLAGATFVARNRVVELDILVSCCRFALTDEPSKLLTELRKELRNAKSRTTTHPSS